MQSLSFQPRITHGKKVKHLRKEGFLPAVLYGPKIAPSAVQVPYKEFERVYKDAGESSLINLKAEGPTLGAGGTERSERADSSSQGSAQNAILIREIQQDAVSRRFLHADFYQVPLDEHIEVNIPVEYEGTAPGAAQEGGTLVRNMFEIAVRALPVDLPHEIRVDVSSLAHMGDAILIKDLAFSKGVEVLLDGETVVAFVEAPHVEEEIPVAEEATGVEDIKTEGEEKRQEREAKKETEGSAAKTEGKKEK